MTRNPFIDAAFCNAALVEELYEKYQSSPASVDFSWQRAFSAVEADGEGVEALVVPEPVPEPEPAPEPKGKRAPPIYHLIHAYRTHGHFLAKVNPIDPNLPKEVIPELDPYKMGFSDADFSLSFPTFGVLPQKEATLQEIINALREIYCGRIGVEYMGLQEPELEKWLQECIEPTFFRPNLDIDQKRMILHHLNKSELFEIFLHTKYSGQKRFSLEGAEALIPILADIIEKGSELGITHYVIGMAHRGRLNVLSNILNKSYGDIFTEFEDSYIPGSFEGSGDVKYHKGFASDYKTSKGHSVHVDLPPNPSHLEAVDGAVEGIVRARQVLSDDDVKREKVVAILIHGDASISGQGVVYETLQMCKLAGYCTGGTIHVVINNQIGFTTLPKDGRSTPYCTDIARTFGAPVFHVNGEDPEGCVHATNLAVEMRQKFHCDVFLDLNCYRKYGHNESDEPAFTQPLEYQLIRKKQPTRELYRDLLIQQGIVERKMAESLETEFRDGLQKALTEAQKKDKDIVPPPARKIQKAKKEKEDLFESVKTAVPLQEFYDVADSFSAVPEGFSIHKKLKRIIQQRQEMAHSDPSEKVIDWGLGEHLAFATLLWENYHVRLSGQDARRGTFSHRHAMWTDQVNAQKFFPLSKMKKDQGRFDVFNSLLSEYAVLAFEFGYSIGDPNTLVLWEAQFGDFSNGAQIIIDQFISTCEQKWGQTSGLVMLLPHGYEGQGPEHSSGRMERFLQLSGDANLKVVDPTTPAQLFHLLRRQMLGSRAKPLIVFTPKGLLRHPECRSSVDAFTKGAFQEILDDVSSAKKTEKLVFCTGRIFYDIDAERIKRKAKGVTVIRIEQLYPLHVERIKELLEKYKGFRECFWVQEEPSNMGAWDYIQPHLIAMLPANRKLRYLGRDRSASPAAGSFLRHRKEHEAILTELFK